MRRRLATMSMALALGAAVIFSAVLVMVPGPHCLPAISGVSGSTHEQLVGTWQVTLESGSSAYVRFGPAGDVFWLEPIGAEHSDSRWSLEGGVLHIDQYALDSNRWRVSERALSIDFFGTNRFMHYRRVMCDSL